MKNTVPFSRIAIATLFLVVLTSTVTGEPLYAIGVDYDGKNVIHTWTTDIEKDVPFDETSFQTDNSTFTIALLDEDGSALQTRKLRLSEFIYDRPEVIYAPTTIYFRKYENATELSFVREDGKSWSFPLYPYDKLSLIGFQKTVIRETANIYTVVLTLENQGEYNLSGAITDPHPKGSRFINSKFKIDISPGEIISRNYKITLSTKNNEVLFPRASFTVNLTSIYSNQPTPIKRYQEIATGQKSPTPPENNITRIVAILITLLVLVILIELHHSKSKRRSHRH